MEVLGRHAGHSLTSVLSLGLGLGADGGGRHLHGLNSVAEGSDGGT